MIGHNCIYCSNFELYITTYGLKKCKFGDGAMVDGRHEVCNNEKEFKKLICADCNRNLEMCETCINRGD